MFRKSIAIGAVMAFSLLAVGLAGCATAPHCFPAALSVSPSSAAAGSSVTVSSPAASCALNYQDGHTYSVTLSSQKVTSQPVIAPVAPNGRFSEKVPIPADFPSGTAYLLVAGSTYDDCEDGGSCAGYSVAITVK